ncbi:MAG: single-stranded-DNA-specific exonuclease RecJ [bacterium]|nr:single-stranded-DNA-specific exonuclease RecJ [bacterium]
MKEKIWKLINKDITTVSSIQDILKIIYSNRALNSTDSITAFMKPSLLDIDFAIGDMDKVIERLKQALNKKEKIIVYGDYDADGVTATAIMWEALYKLGGNVKPYIPHREREGYGMSIIGIDTLIESEKPDLIITVDQGISGRKQITYAQSKGIEVIVTDHHHKPDVLPENCFIVHDSRVSGAGVAWKTITRLISSITGETQENLLTKHFEDTDVRSFPLRLLELAAIGIVCDLIPLQGESRTIVIHGLEQLKKTRRPGLIALAKSANFNLYDTQCYQIGYIIGPRINAMGRLEHAMDSLRLLCTNNQTRADDLIQKVNLVNDDRKDLTMELINQARKQAEEQLDHKILILGNRQWNPGVIGLVASRMVEEFYKPTIVWGSSPDHTNIFKASGRSVRGFNIIDAITTNSEHLLSFGGHPMAAGLSLSPDLLNDFTNAIRKTASAGITQDMTNPSLDIDCPLPFPLISENLYKAIQELKPFGISAEEPLFSTEKLRVIEAKTLGTENKHLKMKVTHTDAGSKPFEAIAFGFGSYSAQIRPGNPIDLAYHVDINEWNGKRNIQLKVRDIKI